MMAKFLSQMANNRNGSKVSIGEQQRLEKPGDIAPVEMEVQETPELVA